MSTDERYVVTGRDNIAMARLLVMRGRLHIELRGIKFRVSTLAALQREGITTARTRAKALVDLNRHIEALGGPADRRA